MSSEFDRRLNDWFDSVEPKQVPAEILPTALREVRATGQQRAPWHRFAATIESAWTTRSSLSPSLVLAVLAVVLMVALAGAAVASGLIPRPSPATIVDGLIAVQDQFGEVPEGELPDYVIRFIDPGTGADVFSTPSDGMACGAHISPDGSQYAFLKWFPHVSGELDIRVAVAPVSPDFQPTLLVNKPAQQFFDPSWAPDGSRFVMTMEAESADDGTLTGYREVWVVPVDGTPARRLTDIQASYSADWSSGGDWIAFVGVGLEHPLYVIRPDGSDVRRLGPVGADSVAWSPVVRDELAYTTTVGRLHVVSVDGQERLSASDGENPESIDRPAGWLMPVWSRDGTKIALAVPNGTLEVFDVATGSMTQIATPASVSRPEWSADGRSLIAVAEDGNLWQISVDGAAPRLIAENTQTWCMSASYALSWQQLAR